MWLYQKTVVIHVCTWCIIRLCVCDGDHKYGGRGGGGDIISVIGEWPVLFLVKRELAIFKNVNCE